MEREKELREEFKNSEIVIPDNLVENVNEALSENPESSWDRAIWNIINPNDKNDPGPAERKVVEGDVMKKEDYEKETDRRKLIEHIYKNRDNLKDDPSFKELESLTNELMKDFFGMKKVKNH